MIRHLPRVPRPARAWLATVCLPAALLAPPVGVAAQAFTIEQVLSPVFPYELVAARGADRIAWIEYERGVRNVYSAAAPRFDRVRLTSYATDDGIDLTGLQISDDGSIATFIRGHDRNPSGWVANPASDPRGGTREVWAIRTGGGAAFRVVEADAYALSPDGQWIAFVRDGQIYRAPVSGLSTVDGPSRVVRRSDEARPVTEPLFRAYGENRSPVWSPDSRRLAFVSTRGDHAYIGVYDMRSPRITYMAPGVDRDGAVAWSPDGRHVAFLRRPGDPFAVTANAGAAGSGASSAPGTVAPPRVSGPVPGITQARFAGGHSLELWVADAVTGVGRAVWRNTPDDTRFSQVRQIQWAGAHIVFMAEPGNWQHWYSVAASPAAVSAVSAVAPTELTPGTGFVEDVALSHDGQWLFYATNIGNLDDRDIWKVRTSGGEPQRLTSGDGLETQPVVFGAANRVAMLYADARRPLSVALLEGDGSPRLVTPLPRAFPAAGHVVPTTVVLTSVDSVVTHNQLFLPRDAKAGERHPALVFVHGGPQRQMLPGYHYMHFYHMAYAMNQYFASQGYVVLSVNYRSGIGYGRDFRTAPNVGRRGMAEYADVLAAAQYLLQRSDVDTARIGIWGLSYGGILTAQGLARNSDIFKAGVDLAGVHSWGNPLDTAAVTYKSSAISQIDRWTSPVLLIHGDDDRNVSFSQTVGLVQALRARNIPYELIVYPDDVHDSLLFSRWLTSFHATDDFLRRHLALTDHPSMRR